MTAHKKPSTCMMLDPQSIPADAYHGNSTQPCDSRNNSFFKKRVLPPAPEWIEFIQDIDLVVLAKLENMRVRAYNVCGANGLSSLKSMLRYYYNHEESFILFRNCGVTTDRELSAICRKYTQKKKG